MKTFRFLEFYSEYSCEGDYNRNMKDSVCFSDVFKTMPWRVGTILYKIKIYQDDDMIFEANNNNYCLLNESEIKYYLNYLSKIFKVNFSIEWKDKFFIVEFKLDKKEIKIHKLVLTLVRRMYEFPMSTVLKKAIHLKLNDKRFKKYNLFNIYSITRNTIDGLSSMRQCEIHDFPNPGYDFKLVNNKTILFYLNDYKYYISNVYIYNNQNRRFSYSYPKINYFNDEEDDFNKIEDYYTLDYWNDLNKHSDIILKNLKNYYKFYKDENK